MNQELEDSKYKILWNTEENSKSKITHQKSKQILDFLIKQNYMDISTVKQNILVGCLTENQLKVQQAISKEKIQIKDQKDLNMLAANPIQQESQSSINSQSMQEQKILQEEQSYSPNFIEQFSVFVQIDQPNVENSSQNFIQVKDTKLFKKIKGIQQSTDQQQDLSKALNEGFSFIQILFSLVLQDQLKQNFLKVLQDWGKLSYEDPFSSEQIVFNINSKIQLDLTEMENKITQWKQQKLKEERIYLFKKHKLQYTIHLKELNID